VWLLNDLAFGLYQCCCSLVTEAGKANYSKANQHPKLKSLLQPLLVMQESRVKMSYYALTAFASCWGMEPKILCWCELCVSHSHQQKTWPRWGLQAALVSFSLFPIY